MTEYDLEEILWRACEAAFGIEVAANDIEALKRRLYSVRAKARDKGNEGFDDLAFVTPPFEADCKLWVVKQSRESAQ